MALNGLSEESESYLRERFRASNEIFESRYGIKIGLQGDDFAISLGNALAEATIKLLNYVRGDLDDYNCIKRAGELVITLEFHHPQITEKCFIAVLSLFFDTMTSDEFDSAIHKIWHATRSDHPDFQAHCLIAAAKKRKLGYHHLGNRRWLYGSGPAGRIFFESSPLTDFQKNVATDKLAGKEVFAHVGAPYPDHALVENDLQFDAALDKIGFPCVIKPVRGGGGKGVTANLVDRKEAEFAFNEAKRYLRYDNQQILVERLAPGKDYRLLFVRGQFYGCAMRSPPSVTGDGQASVEELIRRLNRNRTINYYASGFLKPVSIDESLRETIAAKGFRSDTILPEGVELALRRNANLSTGGSSRIVDDVNPAVIDLGERISRRLGLHSLGVDYITTDISKAPTEVPGFFIEVNKTPGLDVFLSAGADLTALGEVVIGNNLSDIPVSVFIVEDNVDLEFESGQVDSPIVVYPANRCISGNTFSFKEKFPYQQVIGLLAEPRTKSLRVYLSTTHAKTFGLPNSPIRNIHVQSTGYSEFVQLTSQRLGCQLNSF
jgi:cyanophycin synthetase